MQPYTIVSIDATEIDEQSYVFGNHLSLLVQDLINLKRGLFFWDTVYVKVECVQSTKIRLLNPSNIVNLASCLSAS